METKIAYTDENEARIDFSGYIFISRDTEDVFKAMLAELIDQYAI